MLVLRKSADLRLLLLLFKLPVCLVDLESLLLEVVFLCLKLQVWCSSVAERVFCVFVFCVGSCPCQQNENVEADVVTLCVGDTSRVPCDCNDNGVCQVSCRD